MSSSRGPVPGCAAGALSGALALLLFPALAPHGLLSARLEAQPALSDGTAATHAPPPFGCADRGAPFPPPLASPHEPRTRLAPAHVERAGRARWVGLVALGARFPFRLVDGCRRGSGRGENRRRTARGAGGDPAPFALAGSLAGGARSRFDLERSDNEFIETSFRAGLRLRARWRGVEARAELYHVSSHLGDEFLERTGRAPISTSREGVELLVQARPLRQLRVYGGGGLLLRSSAGLDPASVRGGVEWRRSTLRWGPFSPYVAAEAFLWEEVAWDPQLSAEAGVAFGGGRYRLALLGGTGPTRAEQFLGEDETLWGFSFSAALR